MLFGNEIAHALEKLGDRIHESVIEGFERGAAILGDKIAAKLGELNEAKGSSKPCCAAARSSAGSVTRRKGKGDGRPTD